MMDSKRQRVSYFISSFSNIKAVLIDFGCALKRKNSKQVVGTPQYVAPEVLHQPEEGYDSRVDLFSLGLVYYWILNRGRDLYKRGLNFTEYANENMTNVIIFFKKILLFG